MEENQIRPSRMADAKPAAASLMFHNILFVACAVHICNAAGCIIIFGIAVHVCDAAGAVFLCVVPQTVHVI